MGFPLLISVWVVILGFSASMSLALSSMGVNGLLVGPFCALLGVIMHLKMFPNFVVAAEVENNAFIRNKGITNFDVGLLEGIAQSYICEQQDFLIIDEHLQVVDAYKSNNKSGLSEIKVGQVLGSVAGIEVLYQSLIKLKEQFLSQPKLENSEVVLEAALPNCRLVRVRVIESRQSGRLYFAVRTEQELQISSGTQRSPELVRFCAGLAHDLNNLFGSIETSLALLSKQTQGHLTHNQLVLLSNLGKAAKTGAKISADLLNFGDNSRITEIHAVNLNQVLAQVTGILEAHPKFQAINYRLVASEQFWVSATESGLHQVLSNLVYNALDALQEEGDLVITVSSIGDRVKIEIKDTGSGMSEKVMQSIFEPFFTTKRKARQGEFFGGSGLGLSNVKNLVKTWNGEVACESRQGVGTVFTVVLQSAVPKVSSVALH